MFYMKQLCCVSLAGVGIINSILVLTPTRGFTLVIFVEGVAVRMVTWFLTVTA